MTRSLKVLLVDDEPSIVKMVAKRLEVEGYQVVIAMDGQEALERAQAETPDLILLDLMLPKVSGYSVCTTLRQDPRFAKTPIIIIMLSAKAQDKDAQLGLECGADVYIRKPFKAQELLDQIKTLTARVAGGCDDRNASHHGPVAGTPADKPSGGFTLIELMLVIIIIAALASMVVPRLAGRTEEARIGTAKADVKGNLSLALRLYEVDSGQYPTTGQGLKALMEKPTSPPVPSNWKGPYIEQEPLDPWGRTYQYRYPGTHPPRDYDLFSVGPDGVEGNDDIGNW